MSPFPRRRTPALGCALAILALLPSLASAGTGGVAVQQVEASEAVAIAGRVVTYRVRVGTSGTDATGVAVDALLPAGATLTGATADGGCDLDAARCLIGSLATGETAEATFSVRPGTTTPDPLEVRFTASATDAAPGTEDDDSRELSLPLELTGTTTLAVTGVAAPASVVRGDAVGLRIDVGNTGDAWAADGLTLVVDVPAGTGPVDARADHGSCTDGPPVVCTLAPLPIGAVSGVSVTAGTDGVPAGTFAATARVWQQDRAAPDAPDASLALAAGIVEIGPVDVALALADAPEPVFTGQPLRYTATIENRDTALASGRVVTTVNLPEAVDVLTAPGCAAHDHVAVCTADRLEPGERVRFDIDVRVPAHGPLPAGRRLQATAHAVVEDDPITANNVVARSTTVVPVVDLGRAIAVQPSLVADAELEEAPAFASADAIGTAPLAGYPRDGGDYALLTTGDARLAGTPNTSPDAGVGVSDETEHGAHDATVLRLDLDVPAGARCLRLDVRFLTEEATELAPSRPDTFLAQLDGSTWSVGPGATVAAGPPAPFARIQPAATGVTALSVLAAAGTTYDAATDVLRAQTPITPGRHRLFLSLFDVGGNGYDSAVLLDHLELVPEDCGAGLATAPPLDPPTISLRDATAVEGTRAVLVELTLSRAVEHDTTVALETRAGTATETSDFARVAVEKAIPAGKTSKLVQVTIVDDAVDEDDETLTLAAVSASQPIADGTATVRIADDDPAPRVSVVDAAATEGDAGTSVLPVRLELQGTSAREVRLLVRTQGGTARGGAAPGGGTDYLETQRELVIPPGGKRANLHLSLVGDHAVERDEQLAVVIVRATSATIARGTGAVTIRDDDGRIPPASKRKALRVTAFAVPTSVQRRGVTTYRIAVRNPNRLPVRLVGLRVCLPTGFSLVRRSGAGALRGVPTRRACGRGRALLRWRNAVTIGGGRTAKMRIGARAGQRRGRFTISVAGTAAAPWKVRTATGTARVRVR